MIKLFYQLLLTLNSCILLPAIYLIKEHIILVWPSILPEWVSYLCYLLFPITMSYICLKLSVRLTHDSIEGGITSVESANNSYLPSYLGYFFVAISINDGVTLFWVFIILFIFTYYSQSLYFNPLFLLFRYHFYYVTTDNGMKIFIITRREIKTTENLKFKVLRRINDFTFIDAGRYE